jgi:hypothetical protein
VTITDLISNVASWPTLLIAVLVYGFAPGFLLRLIVLIYEKDDPRRRELIAELYTIPRHKRPFWVAEQIETALFDGFAPRVHGALSGRVINRWKLSPGVEMNRAYPGTFWVPSAEEIDAIGHGDLVKLIFTQRDGWTERMWVEVSKIGRRKLTGYLLDGPFGLYRLHAGERVSFKRDDIIDYDVDTYTQQRVLSRRITLCAECKRRNEPDPRREFDEDDEYL